jgi:1-aminocyclopropane-1-carboxylate deaminase/D-cysteine desulfhydrase-like pyridoxal-dependent ACC family enzyme
MLPITEFAYQNALTPVQACGGVFLKRDDLYLAAGAPGGKARTCWALAQGAKGLVTASSRSSPQMNIVARIAASLGIPARLHCPLGALTPEMKEAQAFGAEIIQHKAGYNAVIKARAAADAQTTMFKLIPFGMECAEAVAQTAGQGRNIPVEAKRIVVPVGSGMSLAGILHHLVKDDRRLPVIGVSVGADPRKRLDQWAPLFWNQLSEIVNSGTDYHVPAKITHLHSTPLDPFYEAKCIPFLQPGDLLWIVGIRASAL